MKKADVLIKNAYIITMDHDRNIISNGCIVIDKDKITAVGGGELASCYEASRVVDAKGKFVFPGMISTHSHLFQTMLKGLGLTGWTAPCVRPCTGLTGKCVTTLP